MHGVWRVMLPASDQSLYSMCMDEYPCDDLCSAAMMSSACCVNEQ